ncbi:Peptidoglycan/LPS O-acetylase OafA/YrhL, contains acyltransferase and SGNH-hydrolase domains [Loktanella atrilutea]|uniref:Peptidoglycan/LPS O-acetylase OafA/YrhL, contains acyltransferase and SGNH-hydrolase domains n=1 Tax=Loktanella atrilutea TaxID=366533 RepID=A0A1M5F4U2_LOKAT|nr:acyltransferase [Loktanella atrilutea]SHF86486.1 Peptidoglycan/LPS O-acetylase OafA/YrhL, contains acyltransferase and SGNH-hydrolase domains [Loktanella atrilutea]
MIYLGMRAKGRDNNLNLIRMLAATAVLVSHAVPLTAGPDAIEPLTAATDYSLGSLSVMLFFVISGFLITASFERSSSRMSFVLARGLRLFPGLVVNLLLVAFLLGPVVTSLPVGDYLAQSAPYAFVIRDVLLFPLVYVLPGVFVDQPFPSVVGSIWTLRHEVMCYAAVFLAGVLGLWQTRQKAALTLGFYVLVWGWVALAAPTLHPLVRGLLGLSMPFAIGVAFYIWRDRLPLSPVGVALTIGLAWLLQDSVAYPAAVALAIGYSTFWVAYVPGGAIRAYNRLGDYSYGIYIYAFPLQGAAVWAFGPQSAFENVMYSLPPTLLLSMLSWHLIESPAMHAKAAILTRLRSRSRVTATPVAGDSRLFKTSRKG